MLVKSGDDQPRQVIYEWDEGQVKQSVIQLLEQRPLGGRQPLALYILRHDDEFANIARSTEVLGLKQTAAERRAHIQPFEERCFFLQIVDRIRQASVMECRILQCSSNAPTGNSRAIEELRRYWGPTVATKAERIIKGSGSDWGNVWDIISMASAPTYQEGHEFLRSIASLTVYSFMYMLAVKHRIRWFIGILSPHMYKNMTKTGYSIMTLADPQIFMGISGTPFMADVTSLEDSLDPLTRQLLTGHGDVVEGWSINRWVAYERPLTLKI